MRHDREMDCISKYKIAEDLIEIRTQSRYIADRMNPFLVSTQDRPDMIAKVYSRQKLNIPDGKVIMDEYITWTKQRFPWNGYSIFTKNRTNERILSLMNVDSEWTKSKIHYSEGEKDDLGLDVAEYLSFHFIGIMFRNNIINNNGLVVHASAIKYRNKGVIFSAPSGTGKSTHAKLWEDYSGGSATVLNDDSPAIKLISGVPYVFGTPWSGSSDKFINAASPIAAIVILEQADINSIMPLSIQQSMLRLMPRCLLPYYNREMMHVALNFLDRIIKEVPVYILKCRPDYHSVEKVMEYVYK